MFPSAQRYYREFFPWPFNILFRHFWTKAAGTVAIFFALNLGIVLKTGVLPVALIERYAHGDDDAYLLFTAMVLVPCYGIAHVLVDGLPNRNR